MLPQTLKTYIETAIIPRYEHFDKAHNLSHVQTVMEESMALCKLYPETNPQMVYTIAAYHDLGLCKERETHHIISGEILMADKQLRNWFTEEEIRIMKEAVEDHRASNKQKPRSIYGCIVAEADRQIDTDITLLRTIQYGLRQAPNASREWHYERFLHHLQEKYAPGGYLKLWIPKSKNATHLRELQAIIADKVALRQRFETLFDEECKDISY
ncbi:MAG: HD domain-containing protein [Bacteroides sp.]|nr:HD domain-containing protein [Bacteroides sp.]